MSSNSQTVDWRTVSFEMDDSLFNMILFGLSILHDSLLASTLIDEEQSVETTQSPDSTDSPEDIQIMFIPGNGKEAVSASKSLNAFSKSLDGMDAVLKSFEQAIRARWHLHAYKNLDWLDLKYNREAMEASAEEVSNEAKALRAKFERTPKPKPFSPTPGLERRGSI